MKKINYFIAAAAVLTACNGGNTGYTVTGTVEGATDGEMVYLQTPQGRELVNLDSAVIKNGTFTLKGKQDTAVNRFLTYNNEQSSKRIEFFLENGKINVKMGEKSSATGTATNDAYQAVKDETAALQEKMNDFYKTFASDSTMTEEQREAKIAELRQMNDQYNQINIAGAKKNITNAAGVYLLKRNSYYMSTEELDELLPQIPEAFSNDPSIIKLKEAQVAKKATAVGQKFTDFEMQTPDGKTVKLSDYAGKGKVVLVDFWASWCGPCRGEMPNIVEIYKKYKGKKFEIVGVSFDRDAESWKKGIKQLGITWPQMSDLKFWDCIAAKLYAVNGIPHTMLIDGEGTIIARGLHGEELKKQVAEALK